MASISLTYAVHIHTSFHPLRRAVFLTAAA